MDKLGYDHIWVTEHHFAYYGGTLPQSAYVHGGHCAHNQADSLGSGD